MIFDTEDKSRVGPRLLQFPRETLRPTRRKLPLVRRPEKPGQAIWVAIFLTAIDSINRVTPLMIMLIPTSVQIAHTELVGQCT